MDPERERIQADLRGIIEGEVRCDELFTQMYATDASIYEILPLGVIRPKSLQDVVTAVQYAAENGISIHPRGSGSGLAGESLGPGLILDFAHSFRRPIDFDVATASVQSGMSLAQLNRYLARQNRKFGPDPANSAVTTMGSVAALDASGSRWLHYGSARQNVRSMQVVLADGQVVRFDRDQTSSDPRVQNLSNRIGHLAQTHIEAISAHRPKTLVNRCGYHLYTDDGQPPQLTDVMVGSEGTLGIITELTVDTVPVPAHRGVALLLFERLELAARAALELRRFRPWACDLLDRRLMRLASESEMRFQVLLPEATEASLLIEVQDDSASEVRGRLEQMIQVIQRKKKLAFDSKKALEPTEVQFYWSLADSVVPSLYQLKGQRRALPFIEDLAVPPPKLPEFLVTMQNVLKQHEVTASLFCHAGHGQLHIRPFLDLANLDHVHRLHQLAKDMYQEVIAIGGTISGEHGTGLSRTWFVPQQFGPLYEVFRQVKQVFDPSNIMNPGKVVAAEPQPISHNLRPVQEAALPADSSDDRPLVNLQLQWEPHEVALAARSCNGCGRCHTLSDTERMCPIFRAEPSEEASPRAKANLMRALMTGRIDDEAATTDALKQIADLCFNCHQCRLDCPAGVDIPKLMIECKAQYVDTNGLRFSDWLLGRIDLLCSYGSRFPRLANLAVRNPQLRWILEKFTGIAIGRKLPTFTGRSFMRSAERRRLSRPNKMVGEKVLYFVDLFANYFDIELAHAFVAILEHHGVSVYIPGAQLTSAMPMISQGDVERARGLATRNVTVLADAIRQGYHVVTTEPSAALCLTQEYPALLGDADSELVAEHTSEACDYLWKMHLAGKLELDLKPLSTTVAYHEPCHSRALKTNLAGRRLLELIPGMTVHSVDKGCSGMAGIFGLRSRNYRTSLRIGLGMINAVRNADVQIGCSECSACRLQMQQGASKPTQHPLKLLATSYGLVANPTQSVNVRTPGG